MPNKVITYGFSKNANVNLSYKFNSKLPGDYNKYNILAAIACTRALGINDKTILRAVASFEGLSGRMEEVKNNRGVRIIIDFAHTPNGLEQVLKTLRKSCKGKLIAIIGAEGKRDVVKRPLLGNIAQKLSDLVVVTAVDPRGDLKEINQQIISGAKGAGGKLDSNLFVIDERAEAINYAINKLAKKDDTVGIFGKGHEKSINLDDKKEIPWSDVEVVKEVLRHGK